MVLARDFNLASIIDPPFPRTAAAGLLTGSAQASPSWSLVASFGLSSRATVGERGEAIQTGWQRDTAGGHG